MNILITGGAGFMGSAFIRYILEKNLVDHVVNYDNLTYAGNLSNLQSIEHDDRYQFVRGDIRDGKTLREVVKDQSIDTIVNFAAETHVDRSIEAPQIFIETNVLGTGTLLQIALEYDLRFHHISTDEVFGELEIDDPKFNENTPYAPRSPYSASKAAADHLVQSYFETYGVQTTISNSSNNYGPYQYPEKLIPLFITNLIRDKKVPVYGDGLNIRDWLYVEDHAEAVWQVLTKGTIGEQYCVGGESEKTNLEISKHLLQTFEKDTSYIEFVEDRKGHDRRYAIDISKIKEELKWSPLVSFEIGIEKTIQWYKDNQSWWEELITS
ncbi:dTDP-glucose 4,6-dehydratase [Candidatus Dojkabacteria bacterium]|uniref:dTDP-glucose 4,6-dehydratase n=1 Tax=Candidatus Dojkabacteria bacterium TaxID=2099670 RepID=A0A955L7T9_9BACT|nr:dTDP-glucose 4,6-dehydratase [Candidatus Dojkabacteria bacterium]